VLESWGDGTAGTEFSWYPNENRLVILDGNGNDYKFWVHDGSEEPNTGVIDNITVYDPNDNIGDFSLLIGYPLDPNDPNSAVDPNKPGALHWKAGDLTYDGGTSTIVGIHLAGNIATEGNVECECRVPHASSVGDRCKRQGAGPSGLPLRRGEFRWCV
jgi:hypothetical protein